MSLERSGPGKRKVPNQVYPDLVGYNPKRTKLAIFKTTTVRQEYLTPSSIFVVPQEVTDLTMDTSVQLRGLYHIPNAQKKGLLLQTHDFIFESALETIKSKYPRKEPKPHPRRQKTLSKRDRLKNKIAVYLSQKIPVSEISKALGCSNSYVRFVEEKLMKQGTVASSKRGCKGKLQPEHLNFCDQILLDKKEIGITIKELKKKLCEHFNLDFKFISCSGLYKAVRRMGYTLKKVQTKSPAVLTDEVLTKRVIVVKKLVSAFCQSYNVVYIDETAFYFNEPRSRGYGKKGKRLVRYQYQASARYSVVAAMNEEGMLAYQIFKGSIKGVDFCGFICQLYLLLEAKQSEKELVLVMDNASIHKTSLIQEKLFSKIKVVFNAPYTPELNAIEELFSMWKALVRKENPQTEDELIKVLLKTSKQIESVHCKHFIGHTFEFYTSSFERKPFD